MNPTETKWSVWRARLYLFALWLVRVDPELLSGCPMIDRFQTVSKALLLGAVGCIALFAWGAFFFLFWPFYVALPLTALAVLWIVLMDQFIGAARWALHGILANPAKARGLGRVVLVRLGIGLVTSFATSFSATLAINHAGIEEQLQTDRDAKNAAKRAEGEADKTRLRAMMLGELDSEARQAGTAAVAAQDRLDAARREAGAARDAATAADLAAN
jgi:hypothetical protein